LRRQVTDGFAKSPLLLWRNEPRLNCAYAEWARWWLRISRPRPGLDQLKEVKELEILSAVAPSGEKNVADDSSEIVGLGGSDSIPNGSVLCLRQTAK
jgi:hypothetical protein